MSLGFEGRNIAVVGWGQNNIPTFRLFACVCVRGCAYLVLNAVPTVYRRSANVWRVPLLLVSSFRENS